ncbi:beta-N-acetylhexosaminidase [Segetibacter koreensis]|uniref:beta-N-acetylhexosaminidase n=1 Tax=Segetibacter koreensis TaxID=398037 RepID=UPI0003750664|nr:beta-N-acetylhexosaminidase [Segetibacter koreensis]
MKKIFLHTILFATISILLVCNDTNSCAAQDISIIPLPAQMQKKSGSFAINKQTKIEVQQGNPEALRIAKMLAQKLQKAAGLEIAVIAGNDNNANNTIFFTTVSTNDSLGNEGYQLSVTNQSVIVKAAQPAGLFYGMQTIAQLLPAEIESTTKVNNIYWIIPAVEITDVPRFTWRGQHLDVCRHFVSVDFIKKYIDNMAMHKLNTFHWHLTEDQGWRLEIKKYPKLTEVGAWRKETLVGHIDEKPKKFDGKRYGGFYTQEQAREVVQYAKDRFITVVPEIEMPGHATAAIAAYPELGVTGKKIEVATYWGVLPDIFNVDESTFTFLENVLSEVMEIFPGQYIHIGGDEAIKDQWKASPKIQQKIKELGLKNEEELQSYFMKRIEKFVNSKGRKVIGWDEIIEGGLSPNVTVMSWRGMEGGVTAAKSGHDVIMAPVQYTYFWFNQGDPKKEPLSAGGYLPLEKVYSFEPVDPSLTPEEAKHVLGAHGSAWAEYMESEAKVEYMVFPRISALAEVVWTPGEKKDWKDFARRMRKQFKRYDYRKINYAKTPLDIGLEKK